MENNDIILNQTLTEENQSLETRVFFKNFILTLVENCAKFDNNSVDMSFQLNIDDVKKVLVDFTITLNSLELQKV